MRQIETCLSPDLLHLHTIHDKMVVVIDVLRATSCFTAGIGAGVTEIVPRATEAECFELRQRGYVIAGERNGLKIPGFDIGNSPFEYMEQMGKKIASTTTNGTKTLNMVCDSPIVLIGSFLNLSAICRFVKTQDLDLLLVCSGWQGRFSMEDSLFAGAVVDMVYDYFTVKDDASIACCSLFLSAKNDLVGFLKNCSHFNRLKGYGLMREVEFCLSIDRFDVLPKYKNGFISS